MFLCKNNAEVPKSRFIAMIMHDISTLIDQWYQDNKPTLAEV